MAVPCAGIIPRTLLFQLGFLSFHSQLSPTWHVCSYFQSLIISLYFVAGGDHCPGESTKAKVHRFRFQVPADLTCAVGHISHPCFPLGLHRILQAFPWSQWIAHFLALSYRVRPGRFTSLILGSLPLPSASEVLEFLFDAMWASPFSRLLKPILVGDQQHLLGLAKSCDPLIVNSPFPSFGFCAHPPPL